ncbi:MAG: hypothetical protein DWQ02_03425, partial [Bacteroidetes bacterium]
MITIKRILPILFVLFVIGEVVAQQVWPVQLTGAMIPPRSLDLGVYGADRPQDLFFNALLNDPVEPSLQVRLELSIERNGEVLYITDPNYLAPPITLSQFQMMQIDGSMLRDYLNNANLVGAQNTGMGAIEIPEGFNQICLQVYGVERNVPVSNKFCVQGSFVLNQPPQAIVPSCGELLELPETQNQLFTWQPMHLGSSNSPGAVEYKFEMVQLPEGTYNANDAFESSLQVYQTTTMTPSLIYTQAEPQLEPGKLYAWRVKAYPMMHPTSKLFQNSGYSEICTFMYYEGEKPGLDITAFNNPSPTGCEVFNTDYGPISNTEPVSTPLVETDMVALGYFTMEITEATGGAQGFNGTGKVRIPMFNAYVNVEFTGLRVNSDMRVFAVEEAKAVVDQPFALDKVQLQAEVVPTTINENYVNDLNDFFSYGDGVTRVTSGMNLADPTGYNLPIAMDQTDMPLVSVIGIYFTPRNAFINLVSWKGQGGNDPMRFAATAVQATPYGVKNGSHLVALNEGAAESFEKVLESIELSRRITPDVKMDCDCEGAGPLETQASLNIAPEVAVREADQGVILLEPAKNAEVSERFVGEVKGIPDFLINGIDDIVFSADKGYLNLSTPRRGEDWDTDRGTAGDAERGLTLTEAAARIPEEFNFLREEPVVLGNGSMFIDNDDVSRGYFYQANLLSLEEGILDKWAYSVDTMALEIENSTATGTAVKGRLRAPLFKETFNYSGFLFANGTSNPTMELDVEPGTYNMHLWYSQFELDENSHVQLEIKDMGGEKLLYPKGKFSGELSLELSAEEVTEVLEGSVADDPELLAQLVQALEVEHLGLKINNLKLTDLEVDPYAELTERYTLGHGGHGDAEIGDIHFDISHAELVHKPINATHEELGLKIHLDHDNKDIAITVWADTYSADTGFPSLDGGGGEALMGPIAFAFMKKFYEDPGDGLGARGLTIEVTETSCSCVVENEFSATTNLQIEEADEELLVLPFLKISDDEVETIAVTQSSGRFKATSEVTNQNANSIYTGSGNWPINITERLSQLGIGGALPDKSKLFITGVDVPSAGTNGLMELTMLYELDASTYLIFKEDSITFSNNNIDMTDMYFHLEDDVRLVIGSDTLLYDMGFGVDADSIGSFARISCDGLQYFNIHGFYNTQFTSGGQGNRMVKRLAKPVDGEGADFAEIPFYLKTEGKPHVLEQFIAEVPAYYYGEVVKAANSEYIPGADDDGYVSLGDYYNIIRLQNSGTYIRDKAGRSPLDLIDIEFSDEDDFGTRKVVGTITERKYGKVAWNFAVSGAEQIIFQPGAEGTHEAYLDFDAEAAIEGAVSTSSVPGEFQTSSWKGLFFKQISFELDGFKQIETKMERNEETGEMEEKRSNVGLTFPIENAFFNLESGMTASFAEEDALPKERNALLGGWRYDFTWLSFKLERNEFQPVWTPGHGAEGTSLGALDHDAFDTTDGEAGVGRQIAGVYIEGNTLVPIFDEGPPDVTTDQVSFEPGWVGFSGLLDFTTERRLYEPRSQLYCNSVQRKTYHSAFIPALGIRLGNGSGINLVYNAGNGEMEAICEFNGSAGIFWSKEIIDAIDGIPQEVKDATNGINFVLKIFKFQGLKINDGATNCDSEGAQKLRGMKSLHFGEWSVSSGLTDFASKVGEGTGISEEIAESQEEYREATGLQGFPVSVSNVSLKCFTRLDVPREIEEDGETVENPEYGKVLYRLAATISVHLKKDAEHTNDQSVETAGIGADAQVHLIFDTSEENGFEFKEFELGCIAVNGKFGPFSMEGGLNILRSDGADSQWGDGFKGFIDINFKAVNIKAVAQYGTTRFDPDVGEAAQEDYRYFFFDLEGSVETGLVDLPPPSPTSGPVMTIYGAGGGFLYNMDRGPGPGIYMFQDPSESNRTSNFPDNNTCDLDNPLLAPGVNLYGETYRPNQGRYGGNVSVILGAPPRMPKVMVGDVTLKVGITINDAGTPGFDYIGINGNAYTMANSVAERTSTYVGRLSVGVNYYHQSRILDAELGVVAAYPNSHQMDEILAGYEAGDAQRRSEIATEAYNITAISNTDNDEAVRQAQENKTTALKNLSDANFKRARLAAIGAAADPPIFSLDAKARLAIDFNEKKWAFKLGSWGDGANLEPASGLQYALVKFPRLLDLEFKFYMQAGHDTDGIPPITELIPAWNREANFNDSPNRTPDFSQGGDGFCVGGMFQLEKEGTLGPISGHVDARIGFDFSMMEFAEVTCGDGEEIGLEGWYAKGQAYAFADASLNLEYDLYFSSGKVNIFDAQLAAVVQAELPNPSYIHGFIKGHYSVLGGAIEGKFNYKFEYGETCSGLEELSPVAGVKLVEEVFPDGEDGRPVNIFVKPKLSTNWQIGSVFSFPNFDPEDNEITDYDNYRATIEHFRVAEVGTANYIPCELVLGEDGTTMTMEFSRYLKPNTEYSIEYKAIWEVD